MSERQCYGDGLCEDGAPEFHPGRASRAGRRSGVILPVAERPNPGCQDSETILLDAVKAAPRRSSIIKDPSAQKPAGGRVEDGVVQQHAVGAEGEQRGGLPGLHAGRLRAAQGAAQRAAVLPLLHAGRRARLPALGAVQEGRRARPPGHRRHPRGARPARAPTPSGTTAPPSTWPRRPPSPSSTATGAVAGPGGAVRRRGQHLGDGAALPAVAPGGAGGAGRGAGEGSEEGGAAGVRMRADWLAAEFAKGDEDGYGIVPEDVAVETICRLCPRMKEAKVRLRFKEIQRSKEKLTSHVTLEEFQEAYCELCTRPDVYFLLVQLSKDRECLDAQDLRLFLETEQGLSQATAEGCLDVVRRFEPSDAGRERGLLGLDGFARYLQSAECQLFDPEHQRVCQDMSLPLPHYYVSASYRSYLLEDQVHGRADLGGLTRALQGGCRCLELGVTDGPDGEPLLGWSTAPARSSTTTTTTTTRPPSPCAPPGGHQQHLRKAFGPRLYVPSPRTGPARAPPAPSPEQLKGRVLLVGKLPGGGGSEGEVSEDEEEIGGGGPLAGRRMTIPGRRSWAWSWWCPRPQPRRLRLRRELSALVGVARTGSRLFYAQRSPQPQGSPGTPAAPPPGPALLDAVLAGRGRGGPAGQRGAGGAGGLHQAHADRVRPSSVRLDSSNPNPQGCWRGGCQLVALNQQTAGAMLDLHRARFAQNGGCGYVLRPAVMREEVSYFSARTQGCVPGVPAQTLRVKVIGAHGLPKPQGSGSKGEVIDPYVVLELHGVPADCAEQRTRTAAQNQDDPLFDETFEFQVNMPELALLRFVVLDDDYIGDDFIGQYSVAFECLQPGYRNVPLLDASGEPLPTPACSSTWPSPTAGGRRAPAGAVRQEGARRGGEYVTLRNTGVRALDDTFRPAGAPLREAADLREDAQNATVHFKEQCGLPPVAKLKQCIQSLTTRLQTPEGPLGASLAMREGYPCLEPLGPLPDGTRKLLSAYDTMISAHRQLVENADSVQEKIAQVQREGMEFHEDLPRLVEKEGLKGRKQSKALESFAWNITVLKGQSDLLRGAKMDALDAMRQLALACEAFGLTPPRTRTAPPARLGPGHLHHPPRPHRPHQEGSTQGNAASDPSPTPPHPTPTPFKRDNGQDRGRWSPLSLSLSLRSLTAWTSLLTVGQHCGPNASVEQFLCWWF
ncbi:hypothetical protein ANANG_G00054080 [Anguilla anguilla]|uniref:Phosphoinositide phospholipase C n=1 Tax=Anguilla anguilla TaxID=7936 RepID=A0A9D3S1D2_ANGAN|nr:hypothetical protein ANANG_G00054080 [Anguilla anguilla]